MRPRNYIDLQKKMKAFLLLMLFAGFSVLSMAQPIDNPAVDLKLVIQSSDGNNGMSVTYNPDKSLYYVAYGGNDSYPLEIFTAEGKNVYSESLGFDIRGMVYHPKWNCLIGNCYDDGGYYKIILNESGMPTGQREYIFTGLHQPTAQSGGTFNVKKGIAYYLYNMTIQMYSIKNGSKLKTISLTGFSEREMESCVSGSILYTGEKGYEFMVINYVSNKLYFFNSKGAYVKMVYFNPEEYLHDMFNVSYCNKRLWTYNKDSRQWTSYKLFR